MGHIVHPRRLIKTYAPMGSPLTSIQITRAKASEKVYRLYDQRGLYLEVNPAGGKYWRLKYRFAGKEKRLALGVFPTVTLADARSATEHAKSLLRQGIDPGEKRKAEKRTKRALDADTFQVIADEWIRLQNASWSSNTSQNTESRLKRYVYPYIGSRPISEILPTEVLSLLRRIEDRGHIDTAHRVKQRCSQIFRYAIVTDRAERDPAADLKGALAPLQTRHRAAITEPKEVGALLLSIGQYHGSSITRAALILLAYTFVRPGELRKALWEEFNLSDSIWRIPAKRMKLGLDHLVPLSRQAINVINDLKKISGDSSYLFPSPHAKQRPISENALNTALRRIGYTKHEMTAHGFRTVASTLLHENGWHTDIVERQLAHIERNSVKAAYNRAQHFHERHRMMQEWADYLDNLKNTYQN